ncbi:TIGR04376 family protein [Leptolyngbya sp. FACHB-261]|uniref:TIGR04376 family protein n=1 Tax=Leptolyngbya sp. FACHB-261 TaxID=2692806 RepID=UPI00168937F2|nr:TIGR04376 family protein [Leptolyngbya sp. FACHB-261]MBD2103287.1 TIGR04376 family protein [Leptolyngbya sp. FACHB-261]
MSIFDDLSRFLEMRLEEFLRDNPQLELQALEDKLRDQEEETLQLLSDLHRQEQGLQEQILSTAQDIQRWHIRADKAEKANRPDLAQGAREREAMLLKDGNQRWGQMEMVKERIKQTTELQRQIQIRRQEVQAKAAEAAATARTASSSQQAENRWEWQTWNGASSTNAQVDDLEKKFRDWELDDEMEQLKRNMSR